MSDDQRIAPSLRRLLGDTSSWQLTPIAGQASARRYYRVRPDRGAPHASLVAMVYDSTGAEEVSSGPSPTELPFLNLQRTLAAWGIAVPAVHGQDLTGGVIVLEDLGDVTFEAAQAAATPAGRQALYLQAIADLVALQVAAQRAGEGSDCLALHRRFEPALLRWELDHFREWLLEAYLEVTLPPSERRELEASFDRIVEEIATFPTALVHRDYQSRNLMVQPVDAGHPATGVRLRLIDFQDALVGPAVYDLVSLLRDSYVVLPPDLVEAGVCELARLLDRDPLSLRHQFDVVTVQRKLKDAGRFVFIDRVKQNPSFLPHIPASLGYVREALGRLPEYRALGGLLAPYLR